MIGPLATFPEPHCYDLCERHARGLTAPRGWEVVRHEGDFDPPQAAADDLVALADAVREVNRPAPRRPDSTEMAPPRAAGARRGHLRVIPPTS